MLGLVKELNGSLDGLDVSINGVDTGDIPLFSNSLDIFIYNYENKGLSLLNAFYLSFTTLFLGLLIKKLVVQPFFGHVIT